MNQKNTSFALTKLLMTVCICASLAGCGLGRHVRSDDEKKPADVSGDITTQDVDAREFMHYYDNPRTPSSHADYTGVKDAYHYIAVYEGLSANTSGKPTPKYYLRTRSDELPAGFPHHQQPPMTGTTAVSSH